MDNQLAYLSNNSLTVLDPMETRDVKEDGHHLPLTMLKITVSPQKAHIPMLAKIKHAEQTVDHSRSPVMLHTQAAMVLAVLLMENQSQSLLMPPIGVHTRVEYSTIVVPQSTMLSSWSVLLEVPGKSRTLGELDGENKVSLDLPLETLVVSAHMLVSLLTDYSVSNRIYNHILKYSLH